MHPNNVHQEDYDMTGLGVSYPPLKAFITKNPSGLQTIDFANSKAVLALNKALLKKEYGITKWELPQGYLCPPIPGRADYIHHLSDLLSPQKNVTGLDLGTGANAIYTLLGHTIYNWKMVGCDSNAASVAIAQQNTVAYASHIEIRHQSNKSNLLKGIIKPKEYYNFMMCNPPFYSSQQAAIKANRHKINSLNTGITGRNFAGQSNELWCNGGEALFIKRIIKESVQFSSQVGWFTSLVSRKENLSKLIKQLDKTGAIHRIIPMSQGQKKSRFIAWTFTP